MKINEWKKLALQSFVLLLIVLVFTVSFNWHRYIEQGKMVHAGKVTQKEIEKRQMRPKGVEVEKATFSNDSKIIGKSSTYIRVTKAATASAVYLQNQYTNATMTLTISGLEQKGSYSASQFYRSNGNYECNGKAMNNTKDLIKSVKVSAYKDQKTEGFQTEITFQTKVLYEPTLYETTDAYYIILQRPWEKYDKIVVIDAGHGGLDNGTSSKDGKVYEKDCTLAIVEQIKNLFDKSGIRVYYTRLDDEYISKARRTNLANEVHADLFVSIHCNASDPGDTTAYGIEALYSTYKIKSYGMTSQTLAQRLSKSLSKEVGNKNRGTIKRNNLYLLHHAKVPVSIVEVGYMSNASDLKYMVQKNNQVKIATGVYQGIVDALKIIKR